VREEGSLQIKLCKKARKKKTTFALLTLSLSRLSKINLPEALVERERERRWIIFAKLLFYILSYFLKSDLFSITLQSPIT